MPPKTYNYLIDDSEDVSDVPEEWKRHFERFYRTKFSNAFPVCVMFGETTSDADFAHNPDVRQHLERPVALRFATVFRKLMTALREENNELSWMRVFTSVREISTPPYNVRASASDRLCPMVGVGDAGSKYSMENLLKRQKITFHKGLEAFVDLGTSNARGEPKILIMIIVDTTQLSRLGRAVTDPVYEPADQVKDFVTQWLATRRAEWKYPWSCHAWFDMVVNSGLQTFRDLGCRPVIGSFGLGFATGAPGEYDEAVWWDLGNPSWKRFPEFVSGNGGCQDEIDAHFWLEDAEGRVYDVIRPRMILALLNSGQRVEDESFPKDVSGRTKAELHAMGFHYHPAPVDTQKLLFSLMMRQQRAAWEYMATIKPSFSWIDL